MENLETSNTTVTCPKCGKSMSVKVIRAIKADSPELKSLLKGTLNVQTCGCGARFLVSTPIFYSDPALNFFLVQEEYPEDGNIEDIEKDVDATMTDVALAHNIERPLLRLVFSREEFIEKLALVTRGYDDRLIEYAKFQLFQTTGEGKINHQLHRMLFDFSEPEGGHIKFIIFEKETGKHIAGIHIEREDYERMLKEFQENASLQNELDALFPDCYVNVDRLYDYA